MRDNTAIRYGQNKYTVVYAAVLLHSNQKIIHGIVSNLACLRKKHESDFRRRQISVCRMPQPCFEYYNTFNLYLRNVESEHFMMVLYCVHCGEL